MKMVADSLHALCNKVVIGPIQFICLYPKGSVAEWLKAPVLKTGDGLSRS